MGPSANLPASAGRFAMALARVRRPGRIWPGPRGEKGAQLRPVGPSGPLGVADDLVGEEGEVVTDGLGVDKAQGLPVFGLAEKALAGPEHDREDHQP